MTTTSPTNASTSHAPNHVTSHRDDTSNNHVHGAERPKVGEDFIHDSTANYDPSSGTRVCRGVSVQKHHHVQSDHGLK